MSSPELCGVPACERGKTPRTPWCEFHRKQVKLGDTLTPTPEMFMAGWDEVPTAEEATEAANVQPFTFDDI